MPRFPLLAVPHSQRAPNRPFDLIACVHGLHYLGDKLSTLCRAASWLIDDGLLIADLDLTSIRRGPLPYSALT